MAVSIRTWKTKSGEDRKAYVVRYRDGDRKYRLKTFKTRKEAKAWDARTNVDLEKASTDPTALRPRSVERGRCGWSGFGLTNSNPKLSPIMKGICGVILSQRHWWKMFRTAGKANLAKSSCRG